jgi:hypothetical protein
MIGGSLARHTCLGLLVDGKHSARELLTARAYTRRVPFVYQRLTPSLVESKTSFAVRIAPGGIDRDSRQRSMAQSPHQSLTCNEIAAAFARGSNRLLGQ